MAQLIADNLSIMRQGRVILSGIGFTLSSGMRLWLTGGNGCGKTSLLRALAGLGRQCSGRIIWDGVPIPMRQLGVLTHMIGHCNGVTLPLSAAENARFFARLLDAPRTGIFSLLQKAGLPEKTPARFMSAGQLRRLALLRLRLTHAPIWLLDEPKAGLDADAQLQLQDLQAAHLSKGGLIIESTHALEKKGFARDRETVLVLDTQDSQGVEPAEPRLARQATKFS